MVYDGEDMIDEKRNARAGLVVVQGIDLVDCERLRGAIERHGERFLGRVFTAAEREYAERYRDAAERLAGRFAVKEAVLKMLGTGWQDGNAWTDIETVNDGAGRPLVRLSGRVAETAREQGVGAITVSITHAGGMAMAAAVALRETGE